MILKRKKKAEKLEINNIYNMDCLDGMKQIEDESIDLVITDPPYKIIIGGNSNGANSIRPKGMLSGNRNLFNDCPAFEQWVPHIYRVLKEGSHCYIMSNVGNLFNLQQCCLDAGFKLHNLLVWEKNNCTPSQYYMKNCEYTLFFRKGKAKYINNIGSSKTVHKFNNVLGNKIHITEKPEGLIKFYLENSSNENDVVFDPFMGSGTTAIAAMNTGRNFLGFEKDKEYYEVAKKRIEEMGNK